METNDSRKESRKDRYDISEVITVLKVYAPHLEICRGKDMVVFIGPTQHGKSTTINTLRGAKFEDNIDGTLDATDVSAIKNDVAEMGCEDEAHISTTKFPRPYLSLDGRYVYLDTRGFFDVTDDAVSEIASSILLEEALKVAKTVRIVFVLKCSALKDGMAEFDRCGRMLSKIVLGDNAKFFFLFNRFPVSRKLDGEGFNKWPEEKKNDYVKDKLRNVVKKLDASHRKNFLKMLDHAKARYLATNPVTPTTAVPKSLPSGRSLSSLSKSLAHTYPPPQKPTKESEGDDSEASVENEEESDEKGLTMEQRVERDNRMQEEIESEQAYLSQVERKRYISMLQQAIRENAFDYFDPLVEASVFRFLRRIDGMEPTSPDTLSSSAIGPQRLAFDVTFEKVLSNQSLLLQQLIFSARYHNQINAVLGSVQGSIDRHAENLRLAQSGEETDALVEEYDKEKKERENALAAEITKGETKEKELQEKIDKLVHGGEVLLFERKFSEPAGLRWYNSYVVKYPEANDPNPLPYTRVEEQLTPPTIRYKVFADNGSKFEVKYSSGGKWRRRVAVGVAVLLSPAGAVILSATSKKCAGTVRLYTAAAIREKAFLDELHCMLSNTESALSATRNQLIELKNEEKTTVGDKIASAKVREEGALKELQGIKAFIDDKLASEEKKYQPTDGVVGFENLKDELTSYEVVSKTIYANSQSPAIQLYLSQVEALRQAKAEQTELLETDVTPAIIEELKIAYNTVA